jgi:hypothetical protein
MFHFLLRACCMTSTGGLPDTSLVRRYTRPPSSPAPSACVANNDAPLISTLAATRGRSATEGGDEQADVKRRYPFALQSRDADPTKRSSANTATSVSRPHSPPVAGNDAPLIAERAAKRPCCLRTDNPSA